LNGFVKSSRDQVVESSIIKLVSTVLRVDCWKGFANPFSGFLKLSFVDDENDLVENCCLFKAEVPGLVNDGVIKGGLVSVHVFVG